MYVDPVNTLAFGDVIEAPWLFDAYVRGDTRALAKTTGRGGQPVFVLRPEPPERDGIVSAQASMGGDVAQTADFRRFAVVLTDDCELDTLLGRQGAEGGTWSPRGRILCAAIRAAEPQDLLARADDYPGILGQHPFLPDDERGFPGGLADFNRLFQVGARSLVGDDRSADLRVVASLDDTARAQLLDRWTSHVARMGPRAWRHTIKKLSQLISAHGSPEAVRRLRESREWGDPEVATAAAKVAACLEEAWVLGTDVMSHVDSAAERLELPEESLRLVTEALEAIRDRADAALQGIRGAT